MEVAVAMTAVTDMPIYAIHIYLTGQSHCSLQAGLPTPGAIHKSVTWCVQK